MGHPFGYRRRLKAVKDGDGQLVVVLPAKLLELMGITGEDTELLWKLNEDGTAQLAALR